MACEGEHLPGPLKRPHRIHEPVLSGYVLLGEGGPIRNHARERSTRPAGKPALQLRHRLAGKVFELPHIRRREVIRGIRIRRPRPAHQRGEEKAPAVIVG